MAFPTSPSNNQVHKEGNRAFVYDSTLGTWDQVKESDRTARSSYPLIEEGGEVTFPSGHMIQSRVLSYGLPADQQHISTGSDTFVDTGVCGSFTTVKSSADSWLMFEFNSGMTHHSAAGSSWGSTTLTLKTSDTETYATGDDIVSDASPTTGYRNRYQPNVTGNYHPQFYRYIYHAGDSPNYSASYPTSLTSYSAGQKLYARMHICEPSGGTFYLVHSAAAYNLTVKEMMR